MTAATMGTQCDDDDGVADAVGTGLGLGLGDAYDVGGLGDDGDNGGDPVVLQA